MYAKVGDVDWENWNPEVRATLMFVIRDGKILLIHKKRGFGMGKINGPGGKLEPGETPMECAVRETQEELCITPTDVKEAGLLHFQFADGYSIHGVVFTSTDYEGEPTETDEAIPLWADLENIPFDRMWEDDSTWFPYMLSGRYFSARYIFDTDHMLDYMIDLD